MMGPRFGAGVGPSGLCSSSAWQVAAAAAAMRRPVGMWMRGGPSRGWGSAPTNAKASRQLMSCLVGACAWASGSCKAHTL